MMCKECCVYSEVYGGPWTLEMWGSQRETERLAENRLLQYEKEHRTCHIDFLWVDRVRCRGPGSIGQVGTGAVVHDSVHFRLQL